MCQSLPWSLPLLPPNQSPPIPPPQPSFHPVFLRTQKVTHAYYDTLTTHHLSPRPFLLSFGVYSFDDSQVAYTRTHTRIHNLFCCNLSLPCIYMSGRACRCLDVHHTCNQLPTLSLSLSYHWLFNVLHTHIVLSAFVCVCVFSWVGVLISGYWWWILIKSLKTLGTLSDLSLLMLAAVGMVRCDTRTYTYPFTYTHLKKRKKGAGLSFLFFSCCCCLGKVETVHLPGMCRVWW